MASKEVLALRVAVLVALGELGQYHSEDRFAARVAAIAAYIEVLELALEQSNAARPAAAPAEGKKKG